jgi:hypothetical protein
VRLANLRQVLFSVAPLVLVACTVVDGEPEGADENSETNENGVTAGANPNAPGAKQTKAQTDEGCGGISAPPCAEGKKCLVGKDCTSLSCQAGACTAPSATDAIKNADESDVDCGGSASPACGDDKTCAASTSCASLVCAEGTCRAVSNTDGVKNGDETDVDCGGPGEGARCGDTKACRDASDCESIVCDANACKPATGDDGVKNGDESDVDCGGTTTGAAKCAVGRLCKLHADCGSDGCGYDSKCAAGRSCTQHMGGDTCGSGEVGQPGAVHGSCCATASLPNSNAKIDKYLVTAGRMRAMIDRLNGNVRGFTSTLPGNKWNQAWNAYVPSNKAEADIILGSYWAGAPNDPGGGTSKRSCAPGDYTGRTYWTAPNGADRSDFSQDQLDVKALNCVGWHLMSAFCAWDGGRMGTRAELAAAYTNGGQHQYPWRWRDNSSFSPTAQDARLNHLFSYNYPDVPGMRVSNGNALDIAYHVSPPGRNPAGWNAQGVEIAGNLLTWVRDTEYWFTWNFSWENHPDNSLQAQSWLTTAPEAPNGYYAIGGRCLHD